MPRTLSRFVGGLVVIATGSAKSAPPQPQPGQLRRPVVEDRYGHPGRRHNELHAQVPPPSSAGARLVMATMAATEGPSDYRRFMDA